MKNFYIQHLVICLSIFVFSVNHNYGQSELGVYKVVDERTKIDYSQLFINYLNEASLRFNEELIKPILINHYSQSPRSFKLTIESLSNCSESSNCDAITLTLYHDGKKIYKENLETECISSIMISASPIYSMEFEEVENGIARIINVPEESPENDAKLQVGTYFKFLSVSDGKVYLQVKKDISDKKWKIKEVELPLDAKYNLTNQIEPSNLDCLFHEIKDILIEKFDLSITSDKVKQLETTKTIISQIPASNREYPSIYLPGNYDNIISKEPQIEAIELFEKERFGIKEDKKLEKLLNSEVGNSALVNHIYYGKTSIDHKLNNQKEVSDELNDLIDLYISPLYNKPGVIINYLNSGDEYFDNDNFPAALNQYGAASNKVNSANMSAKTKTELHYVISEKMANAYLNLKMNSFSKLMIATSNLYKYSHENWAKEDRFYTSIDTLRMICERVEGQVKSKKKKRLWGVIKGAASLGAGTAVAGTSGLSEFGLDMASEFVATGIQVVTDDFQIANEISNSIEIMTSSLDFDDDAFDDNNDGLDIELNFLKALIKAIDTSQNPEALLAIIEKDISDESVLLSLIHNLDFTDSLMSNNNKKILKEIGAIEKGIFNYEVRNLELSEKLQL